MDAREPSARKTFATAARRWVGARRELACAVGLSDLIGQAEAAFGHRKSDAEIFWPCSRTG
jgi:hypothetical protein